MPSLLRRALHRTQWSIVLLLLALACPAEAQREIVDTKGRTVAREVANLRAVVQDEVVALGDRVVFAGRQLEDVELFVSDGTEKGTRELADIHPEGSSRPRRLTVAGEQVFFVADDGMRGAELWRTDGSPGGTRLVRDIDEGRGSSDPDRLFAVNDLLFFVADDGFHGRELWRSDGTEEGTFLLMDIDIGRATSSPGRQVASDDVVYFVASDGHYGPEIWSSNGTVAGTRRVVSAFANGPKSPENLEVLNGSIYFSASSEPYGQELWVTDGTADGTHQVADIRPGPQGSNPGRMQTAGRHVYFSADDGATGRELWRTDGTAGGTHLVDDIRHGAGGANPSDYFVVGNRLFFVATDARGRELWISDGTLVGTSIVRDINGGAGSAFTAEGFVSFVALERGALFTANDGIRGNELWYTDGSFEGTWLVADINPFGDSRRPAKTERRLGFAALRDRVFFAADRGDGRSLWWVDLRAGQPGRI